MEKLKLPIIKHDMLPPSVLSMDEYLEFVMFMKRTFGKRVGKNGTRPLPAKVAFRL